MTTARRLLYTLAVLLVFLSGLEILGRLLPANDNRTAFAAHPVRGWTLPEHTTFSFFEVPATTNSLGLRSAEPQDSPALRVLTLGDSSAFGHGVADGETFSAVLAQRTGADVQNGGVPGYTCVQSASRYQDVAGVLRPDILLVYTLHNDVRKITSDDEIWVNRAATLGVLRLLSTAQRWMKMRQGASRVTLEVFRRCLTGLIEAQQARAGSVLLIMPFEQKHLDARGTGVSGTQGMGHQRPYRDVLSELAEVHHLPFLNLTDTTWAGDHPTASLMLDSVHPTATGHRLIAAQILRTLAGSGVVWPRKGAKP